ncbi:dihydrolipoamide acetyltransferase family protein [Listeria cossartiae subsp. cayugensis]|uniref:Dihydrolipoamide acetyltransferase component of pyruvate dehydrogenase complex n=1 Tax=Listeria cossartiae subsp. cayugensis TaxID=2713505 RepID=A0ABU2IJP7_9LIST|nr:dihydrolipoamide acetyltransferase family protein [Listeria cossartiae]MDT0002996.1 dihydrolipoamide acetyltransferase family protein [Listeria cossartiae subsp. cayugensis]MDT0018636.1 dihydrolipoamide acetyltransferase family protein [Listeria cossartiae subsp. cayugensis]MDT0035791.1 dihydrolipoamide acetyltransferase family protein [Listeria cossartiae subsp. cayugensis]MDT0040386.1 dihydrolipoamide acetyltransferase family protein [Listeria cossartiae subsp. cayugensis]MDT0046493.1 dih
MAVEKITMPKLGESVTEGTISSWLVKPGDTVEKYDAIAEVLTDKVTAEIPSSFSGTIKEILAEEDETLEVGEVICTIETAEAGSSEPIAEVEKVETKAPEKQETKQVKLAEAPASGRFSPAVLRIAGENNIDLSTVVGTGKGGRITRKDLLQVIENGPVATKSEVQSAPQEKTAAPTPVRSAAGDKEIPINGVRKAIAKHMSVSKQEIPHAWMMVDVDATGLVRYRNAVKDSFKKEEGYSLTYFAFFIKAVAQALKEFPQLNSTWAGDKIIEHGNINISIAIAAGDLLYVPVIKNADEKSIKGIAREISELAGKARNGKLSQADMEGGTFTVNSTGSFGSVQSMGIINHPQAAILQVESIVKRPVIIDDMIAVRDMVNLCLSIDHRILDGLLAGKFLQAIKANVEKISKENTALY